jgi:hypothetical protein
MDLLNTMDMGQLAIFIGLLIVAALLIVGWMVYYFVRSSEKEPAGAGPESVAQADPSTATQPPAPSSPKRPAASGDAAEIEVMRLLRDRVTGALVVEMAGKKYRAVREIRDGETGRRFLQTAADLVQFTEVMLPREREKEPLRQPPAPSALVQGMVSNLEEEPPVPRTPAPPSVEQEFLDSLRQLESEQTEFESPSLSPIEFFRRGFAARRRAQLQGDVPAPRSFVDEIEEILQRFVRTYPSFVGKEVHIGTGPEGRIQIQVEQDFYSAPDDIPDPEIRGIIKAAIQEWEKS